MLSWLKTLDPARHSAYLTILLAVLAAFAAIKTVNHSTRAQLSSSGETGTWALFQAKSIKQHVCEVERDLVQAMMLEAQNPETRGHLDPVLDTCLNDIVRHDKEKSDLRAMAEEMQKLQDLHRRRAGAFGAALLLFQLAIVLSTVAGAFQRPPLFYAGLIFGGVGLLFLLNGFLLFL